MLQIFYDRYGWIYASRYDGQIVWYACTWFQEIGIILSGGGGGQLPFGTFPNDGDDGDDGDESFELGDGLAEFEVAFLAKCNSRVGAEEDTSYDWTIKWALSLISTFLILDYESH